MSENAMGTIVIDEAIPLHRELRPIVLESVFEDALADSLKKRDLGVRSQVPVPIHYRGLKFDEGFRVDLMLENQILIELKTVEAVIPTHKKHVQTYLRLAGWKLGYPLNFGEGILKNGIMHCINGLKEKSPRLRASAGESF